MVFTYFVHSIDLGCMYLNTSTPNKSSKQPYSYSNVLFHGNINISTHATLLQAWAIENDLQTELFISWIIVLGTKTMTRACMIILHSTLVHILILLFILTIHCINITVSTSSLYVLLLRLSSYHSTVICIITISH